MEVLTSYWLYATLGMVGAIAIFFVERLKKISALDPFPVGAFSLMIAAFAGSFSPVLPPIPSAFASRLAFFCLFLVLGIFTVEGINKKRTP